MDYRILKTIKSPDDVKKLPQSELAPLCDEIRDCIIDTVSKNGGHLASSLGAVELTVAIHRVFSSPEDAVIFDVGHQSYAHKLLTGRFERFGTLRTENGISGFMRPSESEHDPVVTGHSSNSVSAAYGIYTAKKLKGESGTAVAVIGDGAMTGGMAYEGLNNAGGGHSNFIIILNDNKMSISRNVGALARSLTNLRNRPKYHQFKDAFSKFLLSVPLIGGKLNGFLGRLKAFFKRAVLRTDVFSALGFNYLGPVDGHNIEAMESLFRIANEHTSRPSLIHVVTTKGKGYRFAESSPKNYHGVSPFDIDEGAACGNTVNFSAVAGRTLCTLAENDKKICAVTAAMTEGTGLADFAKNYRERFFDVGIAEQHAVTFCAGLAKEGMKPFFVVYSSFLQRGFDQVLHDLAISGMSVKLLVDRAGIVGEDGESHQGTFDVSYLSAVPGMTVYSPSGYAELEYRIKYAAENDGLMAIRYPRGGEKDCGNYDFGGDFTFIDGGGDKVIVTYGRLFSEALIAKDAVKDVSIVKLNRIYPVPEEAIEKISGFGDAYLFEETVRSGGIGEHLSAALLERGYKGKFEINSVGNEFVPTAEISSSLKKYGLDSAAMIKKIGG